MVFSITSLMGLNEVSQNGLMQCVTLAEISFT